MRYANSNSAGTASFGAIRPAACNGDITARDSSA